MSRDDLKAYRKMATIRRFEERVQEEFAEATSPASSTSTPARKPGVGVCSHLTDEDRIASTHRGHGHCIAKGCDSAG